MVGGAVMIDSTFFDALVNDGLFGLLGHGIMLMAFLLAIFQIKRWKQYWPAVYLLAAIIIIMPIKDWTVIEFSRGYFADLSIATILVCLCYVLSGMRPQSIVISHTFKIMILTMSAIIFPSSLGASEYNLFSLGFPSEAGFNYLVIGLALIAVLAWYKNETLIAIYIALVFLTYNLGLYTSQNLWIYMLDPIVMLIFLFSYLKFATQIIYVRVKGRLFSHV
ncbi:MAG: hypothetical protein ACJAYK_002993 [Crocinitomicaceae bacterium]